MPAAFRQDAKENHLDDVWKASTVRLCKKEDIVAMQASEKIWLDGKLLPWDRATVHVAAHVVHFGSSVFEGIRAYALPSGPAVFCLDAHLDRLWDSCKIYRLGIPYDRDTIYRAILNLVTNAIDACTESESGDSVVVRTRSETDRIVLTVEDNGIGMSEEIRSRLFRRFFSTKAGKGTGLGLPVVRKIVEEHGGNVEVESEPGHGSAFHLYLPRSEGGSIPPGPDEQR